MNRTRLLSITTIVALTTLLVNPDRGRCQESKPVVLFDEGHGQQFLIDGMGVLHLSNLADVMQDQGVETRSTKGALTAEALQGADAVVISGAFKPLGEEEISVLHAYLQAGGRLAVMLHIGPPVADLLRRLGVAISNGVIQERQNVLDQPINFRVTDLEDHPLTRRLEGFAIYGGWALLPMAEQARSLAGTSGEAWVDLNRNQELDEGDAVQAFSVLVVGTHGSGQFAVFADDAMFQNRFLQGENRRLAENLARWLAGGGRESTLEPGGDVAGSDTAKPRTRAPIEE